MTDLDRNNRALVYMRKERAVEAEKLSPGVFRLSKLALE